MKIDRKLCEWLPVDRHTFEQYKEASAEVGVWLGMGILLWLFITIVVAVPPGDGDPTPLAEAAIEAAIVIAVASAGTALLAVISVAVYAGFVLGVGYLLVDFPEKVRGWRDE